jgi:hypothetical protein
MVGFCVGLPTNDGEVASQNDPLAIRDLAQGGDGNVTDVARKGGSGCKLQRSRNCRDWNLVDCGTACRSRLLYRYGLSG